MSVSKLERAVVLIVTSNLTQRQIAKQLDVSEETISRWKKTEKFKELKSATEKEFLNELAAPAIRTMRDLLMSDSDSVRYNAASDILDRTGYKPESNINLSASTEVVIVDDIQ